ncbi:MAG TPA: hypothetical protein VGD94_10860 [Vicinamibacterales bacterium]
MSQNRTSLLLAAIVVVTCGAVSSAQERRPAETRDVPIDLVCAPQAALTVPTQSLRIIGGAEPAKGLFAAGDVVFVNAGREQGVQEGQHYYARRVVEDRFAVQTTEAVPRSIHTGGWITIIEAQADVSRARVSESCDGVIEGDYLEELVLTPVATPVDAGTPDFERPARLILADDRRHLGGEGSLLLLDRGSVHGLRPGQRLTIFRRALDGNGPVVTIGAAFVAKTDAETSLVRIESSREPVLVGDLVAIHR